MTGDAFVILQGEIDALTLLSNNLRQAPIRGPWFREGLRAVAHDTAEQLDEIRDRLREVLAVAGGRACAVLVALLLVATPAFAQSADDEPHARFTHAAIAVFVAASGADLATTMYALGSRTGQEGNVLFAPLVGTPWLAGTVKMGVDAGIAWGLVKLHRTHPKIAAAAALAGGGVYFAVAAHNAQISSAAARLQIQK